MLEAACDVTAAEPSSCAAADPGDADAEVAATAEPASLICVARPDVEDDAHDAAPASAIAVLSAPDAADADEPDPVSCADADVS